MTITPLTEFHARDMAELEKQCFPLPWSEAAIRAEINNPVARIWGAFENGRLLGYAGLQTIVDEGYITNIATSPEHRRHGIADALLRELLACAARKTLRFLTLEVRESNTPARALYAKHGFAQAGRRRGYYEAPREDAVLMTKTL